MDVEEVAPPRGLAALDDDVLTDRARDGDTRAFEALLRRHQVRAYSLAVRITGSSADAEDAVQAAFTDAWRALPRFRGEARFSTWLHRIVANRALALLRHRRPDEPLPDAGDRRLGGRVADGPEAAFQYRALADALDHAVADLPADLRVAWVLREVEHCHYEEVAEIVGVSLSTVRGRIARARQYLAKSMADWR
jgi:RNA polymerase sigma-70 factor, ECF subfamily